MATLLVAKVNTVRAGVADGMTLCANVVMPALFVFTCLCHWAVGAGLLDPIVRLLSPLFRLLMGRYVQGASALLLCLLGGYPVGATALRTLHDRGILSDAQTRVLSCLLFTPSPAFVVAGVGVAMCGSATVGWLLWAACTASTLIVVAVGCRIAPYQNQEIFHVSAQTDEKHDFVHSIARASEQMLTICGTVILFSVVGQFVRQLPLPQEICRLLSAVFEVTNGCRQLVHRPLAVLAAVLSFGGVCTHLQVKSIVGDSMPSYPRYLLVRILHSAVGAAVTLVLCRAVPSAVMVMASAKPAVGQHGSLLYTAFLWLTCVVFLSSIYAEQEKGRKNREKSRFY